MSGVTALDALDVLGQEAAVARLLDACGSRRWAEAMAAARPFGSHEALHAAAGRAFDALAEADWLEAFAAHPRIGAGAASGHQSAAGERWSTGEQAEMAAAAEDERRALATGNAAYFDRFGFTFIVCANGRSAAEMRALLEARLSHERAREIAIAAGEQRRITLLRLDKMLAP